MVMDRIPLDAVPAPSSFHNTGTVQNQAGQQNVYGNIYYSSSSKVPESGAGFAESGTDSQKSLDDSILASLAFPQMLDRRSNVESPYQKTCQWIFELEAYKNWKNSTSSLLWIKGKPGAGKSTLMSHLYRAISSSKVDKPNKNRTIHLEFFFSARGVQLQQSALGMIRSLVNQIFNQDPSIRPLVRRPFLEKRASFGGAYTWDWQRPELEAILADAILKSARRRQVILLIDALDEAGEQAAREIARYLHNINDRVSAKSVNAKICISCRHYPIPSNIRAIEIYVEDHNRGDITSYIRDHVNIDHLSSGDVDGQKEWHGLVELLVGLARGVFQWVRLVMPMVEKSISDGDSPQRIRSWLQKVPEQLESVYRHILERVIDHRYRTKALRLFQWVCLAERPLSVQELRYALAASDIVAYDPPKNCDQIHDFVLTDLFMQSNVKSWSGGLVEVISSTTDDNEIVQVIHQSVNDFMLSQGLHFLDALNARDGNVRSVEAVGSVNSQLICSLHGDLYWSCLSYISTQEAQSFLSNKDTFDRYQETHQLEKEMSRSLPLIGYAALYALKHAQKAGSHRNQKMEVEFKMLSRVTHHWIATWNALERGVRDRLEVGTTALHIAAAADLLDLALYLLQRNSRVDAVDSLGRTALHVGATWGRTDTVKLLVDAGANLHKQTKHHDTPLILAAGKGHIELFSWLLSQGASLANQSETALYAAAFSGSTIISQLCIDAGADVNGQSGCFGNALQAASAAGHQQVVRLLLDSHADVNLIGGYYGTALQAACGYGHSEIVHLLLEAGANVNIQAGSFGNALQVAAFARYGKLAAILIEAGADLNAQGGQYGNALQAASCNNDTALVSTLLEAETDVNIQGGYYGNALQAASYNCHREVMKLLLDAGAHVNAQGGFYGNALQAAVATAKIDGRVSDENRSGALDMLIRAGADVDSVSSDYSARFETSMALREANAMSPDENAHVGRKGGVPAPKKRWTLFGRKPHSG